MTANSNRFYDPNSSSIFTQEGIISTTRDDRDSKLQTNVLRSNLSSTEDLLLDEDPELSRVAQIFYNINLI